MKLTRNEYDSLIKAHPNLAPERVLPTKQKQVKRNIVLDSLRSSEIIGEMKFQKFCSQCNAEYFDYKDRRPKFCSLKCAYNNQERNESIAEKQRKDRGSIECPNCKKMFKLQTGGGKKFCSIKCSSHYIGSASMKQNRMVRELKMMLQKQCLFCGKTFKSWNSSKRIYCSIKCSSMKTPTKSSITNHRRGNYLAQKCFTKGKSGWVELGGKRFFARSSWEANYGCYLQFQKDNKIIKEWFHEPETFWFKGIKRGVLSYLPDFKIENNDGTFEYHEVKGWMDSRSKTKIKRMAKYHPTVRLKIFDSTWYRANAKKLSSLVKGWI